MVASTNTSLLAFCNNHYWYNVNTVSYFIEYRTFWVKRTFVWACTCQCLELVLSAFFKIKILFLDRLSFKLPYSTYSPIHLYKHCWRFKQTWQVFLEHCETHLLKLCVSIISKTQLSSLRWWWHNVILWIQRCQKYTTHLRSLVYLHDKWWQYPLFQIWLWSLSTRTHHINIVYKYHWWWPAT